MGIKNTLQNRIRKDHSTTMDIRIDSLHNMIVLFCNYFTRRNVINVLTSLSIDVNKN